MMSALRRSSSRAASFGSVASSRSKNLDSSLFWSTAVKLLEHPLADVLLALETLHVRRADRAVGQVLAQHVEEVAEGVHLGVRVRHPLEDVRQVAHLLDALDE